jgi:hypothetical protein
MAVCPSDEVLSALVRRSLETVEAAAVTSHLDHCTPCRLVVVAVIRSKTPLAMGTPSEGLAVMPIAVDQRVRSRRLQIAAGALAFVGLGVAGALAMMRSSQASCSDQALDTAYDARRAQLPADLVAKLDPVAAAWRETRRATCGKPVPTACLDARVLELRSFVDGVIADGPAHAGSLVQIGDPTACALDATGQASSHRASTDLR